MNYLSNLDSVLADAEANYREALKTGNLHLISFCSDRISSLRKQYYDYERQVKMEDYASMKKYSQYEGLTETTTVDDELEKLKQAYEKFIKEPSISPPTEPDKDTVAALQGLL